MISIRFLVQMGDVLVAEYYRLGTDKVSRRGNVPLKKEEEECSLGFGLDEDRW